MDDLIKAAIAYRRAGMSVVVIGKNKKPIHFWRQYKNYRINESKLLFLLKQPEAFGIAVVCGTISKNLEVVDIDEKNKVERELFRKMLCKLDRYSPGLLSRLTIASTINRGFHLYLTSDLPSKSRNIG